MCARHRRPILPRFSHQHGRHRRRRMKPERTAAAAAMTSSPRLRARAYVLPTRRRTEPAKLARKTTTGRPATRSRAFSESLPTVCVIRPSPPLRNSLAQSRPPPTRASVALITRTRYVFAPSITSSPLQQCASEADPTVSSEPWYNRVTPSYMTPLQTG